MKKVVIVGASAAGLARIVAGDLPARRFLAAYRTGDRLVGALAVGMPPKPCARGGKPSPPAPLEGD